MCIRQPTHIILQFKDMSNEKKRKEWLVKVMPPRLRKGDAKKVSDAEAKFWKDFGE
jgi:hypothetical protein